MIIKCKNYIDGDLILGSDATLSRGDEVVVSLDGVSYARSDNRIDGLKTPQIFGGEYKSGDDFQLKQHWNEKAYLLVWHFSGDGKTLPNKYAVSEQFVLEENTVYTYDIETGKITKESTGHVSWWMWGIGGIVGAGAIALAIKHLRR